MTCKSGFWMWWLTVLLCPPWFPLGCHRHPPSMQIGHTALGSSFPLAVGALVFTSLFIIFLSQHFTNSASSSDTPRRYQITFSWFKGCILRRSNRILLVPWCCFRACPISQCYSRLLGVPTLLVGLLPGASGIPPLHSGQSQGMWPVCSTFVHSGDCWSDR